MNPSREKFDVADSLMPEVEDYGASMEVGGQQWFADAVRS